MRQPTYRPRTVIVVYEQPQVRVVRHYTRTLVRRVDPVEYSKRFDHVLLDTATLLELTRRLNIEEYMVNSTENFFLDSASFSSRLLHRHINIE